MTCKKTEKQKVKYLRHVCRLCGKRAVGSGTNLSRSCLVPARPRKAQLSCCKSYSVNPFTEVLWAVDNSRRQFCQEYQVLLDIYWYRVKLPVRVSNTVRGSIVLFIQTYIRQFIPGGYMIVLHYILLYCCRSYPCLGNSKRPPPHKHERGSNWLKQYRYRGVIYIMYVIHCCRKEI